MPDRGGGPRGGPGLAARLFLALLVLGPAFAGCSDKGFFVDVPLWKAGYGWEYEEVVFDRTRVDGTTPGALQGEDLDEATETNQTHRLEVFNSTAASVEGIPIYALAVLNRILPPDNETPAEDVWDAWVYSADLNKVEPTYLDWRNQEIQLSGDEGEATEEPSPDATETPTDEAEATEDADQAANEVRRLDWPLTKGREWRHEEAIPMLETMGVFQARAVREYTSRVPAGNFSAIRIDGRVTANDLSQVEDDFHQGLESIGGEVHSVDVDYQTNLNYAYAPDVLNFVYFQQIDRVSLQARGEDEEGNAYDFTFTREVQTTLRLVKFQLLEGLEKPLTFALDVKRGAYTPKPITPASHLAVEILVEQDALNMLDDNDVAYFGLRIFNSSAGEKRLRSPDASFGEVVGQNEFNPAYDHEYLEVLWTFSDILPGEQGTTPTREFLNETSDLVALKGERVPRPGLKVVTATLKLKDQPGSPGQYIYTDSVYYEVYTRGNYTGTRNLTQTPGAIVVMFPVEHTAARLNIRAAIVGAPAPETQCPLFFGECIQVRDAQGRTVTDERTGETMHFESTRLGQFVKGVWRAQYSFGQPGQSVNFEITVRYRPGV